MASRRLPYRRAVVNTTATSELSVVERHGYAGFTVHPIRPAIATSIARHRELFRTRRRALGSDAAGFENLDDVSLGRRRRCRP